jgi:hypothetical protein
MASEVISYEKQIGQINLKGGKTLVYHKRWSDAF